MNKYLDCIKVEEHHFMVYFRLRCFKFSGRGELGTMALEWMIAFLQVPVYSGYFIKNLKNAVWKVPICILHSIFYISYDSQP